jgi:hypothetical protein
LSKGIVDCLGFIYYSVAGTGQTSTEKCRNEQPQKSLHHIYVIRPGKKATLKYIPGVNLTKLFLCKTVVVSVFSQVSWPFLGALNAFSSL